MTGLRPPISLALLAALVLAGGCGDGAANAAGTIEVRDSAGVRIVRTTPAAWPPPEVWRLPDTPSVTIGVLEGDRDYELFQVTGVVGLPDGGTLVSEFGARLRYYDAEGRHVRTLEREGQGPGEAEAFSQMGAFRGDSIYLLTRRGWGVRGMDRMLVLSAGGDYGRDVSIDYPGSERTDSSETILGGAHGTHAVLADGSWLVEGVPRIVFGGRPVGELLPALSPIFRLGPDGAIVDTVARVWNGTWEHRPDQNRHWESVLGEADPPPVRARGTRIYRSSGREWVVDVWEASPVAGPEPGAGPTSRLALSYRLAVAPRPYTEQAREAYIAPTIAIFRDAVDDDARRAEYRARLESLKSPPHVPAVQDLEVDALGNVWLEEYRPPGPRSRTIARQRGIDIEAGPSRWVVLDPEGRLLGSVLLPVGLDVHEIGADYVLGLRRDELGVQYVVRYPVLKE